MFFENELHEIREKMTEQYFLDKMRIFANFCADAVKQGNKIGGVKVKFAFGNVTIIVTFKGN